MRNIYFFNIPHLIPMFSFQPFQTFNERWNLKKIYDNIHFIPSKCTKIFLIYVLGMLQRFFIQHVLFSFPSRYILSWLYYTRYFMAVWLYIVILWNFEIWQALRRSDLSKFFRKIKYFSILSFLYWCTDFYIQSVPN